MTREEAIKKLRKLRETIDRNNAYGEAEEMGIQALEQKPCDDAISRQAVLDMWRQEICYDRTCHYRDEGRCTETFCDFKLFEYKINHMPSVKLQICEDAISRDAVLEKAGYTETEEGWCGYTVDVDYIKSLPPVKPQEPKTGHWIEHPHEAGQCWEYSKYECSECHEWSEDDSDYCPDCGARMVEPLERSKDEADS